MELLKSRKSRRGRVALRNYRAATLATLRLFARVLCMTETHFDQRRAWLDELMARPHLWPAQVEIVRRLAEELGVEVRFWRLDLNKPEKGWQIDG